MTVERPLLGVTTKLASRNAVRNTTVNIATGQISRRGAQLAARRGATSIAARGTARAVAGRALSKFVPILGTAMLAYDAYQLYRWYQDRRRMQDYVDVLPDGADVPDEGIRRVVSGECEVYIDVRIRDGSNSGENAQLWRNYTATPYPGPAIEYGLYRALSPDGSPTGWMGNFYENPRRADVSEQAMFDKINQYFAADGCTAITADDVDLDNPVKPTDAPLPVPIPTPHPVPSPPGLPPDCDEIRECIEGHGEFDFLEMLKLLKSIFELIQFLVEFLEAPREDLVRLRGCDPEELLLEREYTGKGWQVNYQVLVIIVEMIQLMLSELCNGGCSIPEEWQALAPRFIPTMVVTYKEVDLPAGVQPRYRDTSVPYAGSGQPESLPDYRRGQWRGTIKHQGNAQIVVYGESRAVVAAQLNRMRGLQVNPPPHTTTYSETQGVVTREYKMRLHKVAYFSQGRSQYPNPDWVKFYNKNTSASTNPPLEP